MSSRNVSWVELDLVRQEWNLRNASSDFSRLFSAFEAGTSASINEARLQQVALKRKVKGNC
jgi:hypothetical protein